jgi:hypothetical protein
MTLDDIRERCRIEGAHWIWVGAESRGVARIWAPDFTKAGTMQSQPGRRAVWHVKTGKAIPKGWRVFGTCDVPGCIAPGCITCKDPAQRGREVSASGKLKGSILRRVNSRKAGRARSRLTPALIEWIKASPLNGLQVAALAGVGRATVSKVRRHGMPSFEPVGTFTTLLAGRSP